MIDSPRLVTFTYPFPPHLPTTLPLRCVLTVVYVTGLVTYVTTVHVIYRMPRSTRCVTVVHAYDLLPVFTPTVTYPTLVFTYGYVYVRSPTPDLRDTRTFTFTILRYLLICLISAFLFGRRLFLIYVLYVLVYVVRYRFPGTDSSFVT